MAEERRLKADSNISILQLKLDTLSREDLFFHMVQFRQQMVLPEKHAISSYLNVEI